jgi:hypothetical protein
MARKSAISSSEPGRRARPRDDARRLIAERAARLILDSGLSDWSLAKRKAARQLGLDEARALPDHQEIADALQELQGIFQADRHPAQLRAKRLEALSWMRRLEVFSPVLVGGVADGWATEFNDTRLELSAESAKEVEFALLAAGVPYRSVGDGSDPDTAVFALAGDHGGLSLVVRTPRQWRAGPPSQGGARLRVADLEAILTSG